MMNDPQRITLNLKPSLIVEAVKIDTFIRGRIEKAGTDNAEALAYNEQAGDDEYHERKIMGAIVQAAEEVRSRIANIVSPGIRFQMETESTELKVDFDEDILELSFYVSSRINVSMPDTMARIMQRYIVHKVLADWYAPFNNEQASVYITYASEDMMNFSRSFNRVPPTPPPYPYPRHIRPDVREVILHVGESSTFAYQVLPPSTDDVEVIHQRPTIADVFYNRHRHTLKVTATYPGHEIVTLVSKHDDTVRANIHIIVKDNEKNE